jgi:hypothetical protein
MAIKKFTIPDNLWLIEEIAVIGSFIKNKFIKVGRLVILVSIIEYLNAIKLIKLRFIRIFRSYEFEFYRYTQQT